MSWKGQRWAIEGSLLTGIGESGMLGRWEVCSQRGSKHSCWQELGTAGARKQGHIRERETQLKSSYSWARIEVLDWASSICLRRKATGNSRHTMLSRRMIWPWWLPVLMVIKQVPWRTIKGLGITCDVRQKTRDETPKWFTNQKCRYGIQKRVWG